MAEYSGYTDAELIRMHRDGDCGAMDYLMEKYRYLVLRKANSLFLLGGETDDLIQEGMIGLFKAIRDYDEESGGFYNFADLCISRQIYTAIESASRKKHGPLNSYISLSGGDADTEGTVPGMMPAAANDLNPEQMVIDRESIEDIMARIRRRLSPLEQTVLGYYLDGMNYRRIAQRMHRPEKSVDNALNRIRGKIHELMAV